MSRIDLAPQPRRDPNTSRTDPAAGMSRVVEIMNTDLRRAWSGRGLAQQLQVKPRDLLTQLGEWTRLGFLTRTGAGIHVLCTPP